MTTERAFNLLAAINAAIDEVVRLARKANFEFNVDMEEVLGWQDESRTSANAEFESKFEEELEAENLHERAADRADYQYLTRP